MSDFVKPKLLKIATNQLFHFINEQKFWVVHSGSVDLFSIELDVDKAPLSPRKFLYNAVAGDIIMSLNPSGFSGGVTLSGTASDAALVEYHLKNAQDYNIPFVDVAFDRWIDQVSEYTLEFIPPNNFTPIVVGANQKVQEGNMLSSNRSLYWVSLEKGSFSLLNEGKEVEAVAEEKDEQLYPVSEFLPIHVKHRESVLHVHRGSEFPLPVLLQRGVHPLRQFVFDKTTEIHFQRKAAISEQIKHRINRESLEFSRSLSGLKKILNGALERKVESSNRAGGKLLIATCDTIFQSLGRKVIVPRNFSANKTNDPLFLICTASGLRTRKVILRGKWWKKENGHLLAYLHETKEPVALIQKRANSYHLVNKKTGEIKKVDEATAYTLSPEAHMFFPNFDKKIKGVWGLFNFASKDFRKDISLVLVAALIGSLLGLITPILSDIIFDDVIPAADLGFLQEVALILMMVAIIQALLTLVQSVFLIRLETKMNARLQAGLMDHLIRLPIKFFKKFSAGDLTLRALTANTIRQIASQTLLSAALSGAFSIVNLGLLFYYAPKLAWIGIALAAFAILYVALIGWLKLKYDRKIADLQGDIQGILFEFLSGINKIRIGGAERRVFSIWANDFTKLKSLSYKSGTYQNFVEVFNASYPFVTNIFFFFFIYYYFEVATKAGTQPLLSVGAFLAFVTAFGQFLTQCLALSQAFIASINIVPLYERVKPILEATPETQDDFNDIGILKGDIEFNHVSFRYDEDGPLILDDVSFVIKAGEMVAFVGPSGSGKSTILRILLGFETPQSGSVYYDGQEFLTLNKDLLRKQLGVVLQNGALMPGSIMENIIGTSNLGPEEAWEAARMAGIEEDIKDMPMGIHTVISEGSSTISGGQKQRLMIARALVHQPSVIFMDEATSALDNRTQSIVKESLDRLHATRIIVAHRLSTIENADRILVFDKGKIVEEGTYHSLLKEGKLFSKLAKRQLL